MNHSNVFCSPKKMGNQKSNAEKKRKKTYACARERAGEGDLQQLKFCGAVQFYNIQVVHRNEIVANSHCSAIMYRDIRFCGARQLSALQVIYTVISSWVFSWNAHADCLFPLHFFPVNAHFKCIFHRLNCSCFIFCFLFSYCLSIPPFLLLCLG